MDWAGGVWTGRVGWLGGWCWRKWDTLEREQHAGPRKRVGWVRAGYVKGGLG
jgi:hypothetical protein